MKRFTLPLLACAVLLGGCQQIQKVIDLIRPSDAVLNGYTVERDANNNPTGVVKLNVSALDASNEPIAGEISSASVTVDNVVPPVGALGAAQNYTATIVATVDIVVQEIINAVLDIDQSGSMVRNDPERQRVDAAKSFIERITPQDRLAIMAFRGDTPGFRASSLLQDFTGDKALLEAAAEQVGQKGGTPIWDSTLDTLDLHERDTGGADSTRVVVLFTDGERDGGQVDFTTALNEAVASEIKVFTVGLSNNPEDIDTAELQRLADETGGIFANVANPDELEELFNKAFNAIRASGTITVNISPVPPAGTIIQGTVSFDINGETFSLPYAVQF